MSFTQTKAFMAFRRAVMAILPSSAQKVLLPIYHFFKKKYRIYKWKKKIDPENPLLRSDLKDGFLRFRLTNLCNCRCKFCSQLAFDEVRRKATMPTEWYMDYCRPLYSQIRTLDLTGGDPLTLKNTYELVQMMAKEYPAVNIVLETNGIAFTEKWQQLSVENLNIVHFSVNASSPEVFAKGVWDGEAGQKAFWQVRKNYEDYYKLLQANGLEVFAPNVSMVVNKDTACDVRNFIKQSLEWKTQFCQLYFDFMESDINGTTFKYQQESEAALLECYKIERVLGEHYIIKFRAFLSKMLKNRSRIEEKAYSIPMEQLEAEYSDLIELASGRSYQQEYEERQRIRRERGKKTYTMEEEQRLALHQMKLGDKTVCMSPWKLLEISPQGQMSICCWVPEIFRIQDFIKNNSVDWNEVLNSLPLQIIRHKHLNHDYSDCMTCCPLNPTFLEIEKNF